MTTTPEIYQPPEQDTTQAPEYSTITTTAFEPIIWSDLYNIYINEENNQI